MLSWDRMVDDWRPAPEVVLEVVRRKREASGNETKKEDVVAIVERIIHLIGICAMFSVFTNGRPFVTLAARFHPLRDVAFTFISEYLLYPLWKLSHTTSLSVTHQLGPCRPEGV